MSVDTIVDDSTPRLFFSSSGRLSLQPYIFLHPPRTLFSYWRTCNNNHTNGTTDVPGDRKKINVSWWFFSTVVRRYYPDLEFLLFCNHHSVGRCPVEQSMASSSSHHISGTHFATTITTMKWLHVFFTDLSPTRNIIPSCVMSRAQKSGLVGIHDRPRLMMNT